jgi:diacylglycerol kinase family enzyme
MQLFAIFNRDGGRLSTIDLASLCRSVRRHFRAAGYRVAGCHVIGRRALLKTLEDAANRGRPGDVLLAGGGDGTISAAAALAFRSGMTLAVVPAGTMNLFARAASLPLDPVEAVEELADGEVEAVDIATANGRPFVHQFSVGLHSRLVQIRQGYSYRGQLGKMLASLRAMASAVIRPPLFEVEIHTGGRVERCLASAISVSNNLVAEGHMPHPDSLDAGTLGLYVAKPMSPWAMARLCISVLLGRWKQNPLVTERAVESVTLTFPRRKASAKAVIDGELVRLAPRIELGMHPGGLQLLVPRTHTADARSESALTLRQNVVIAGN